MKPSRILDVFNLDLRSLALFRFLLAGALLLDLLCRLPDVRAFYSDAGVLPRVWLVQAGDAPLSLHLASGVTWFAVAVLLAQVALALLLLVGWRTRTVGPLSLLLLASLHARNPLILGGADHLLLGALLWGCLLPLAARWSVDAAVGTPPAPAATHYRSPATAGLIVYALAVLLSAVLRGRDAAVLEDGFPPAGAALLAALLPGAFWRSILRRLDHGRRVRLFFDGDQRGAAERLRLLCTFLAVPHTEMAPAQGSGRATALLQAHGSFVVIDDDDRAHVGWNAVTALLRHSLLLGWAARHASGVPGGSRAFPALARLGRGRFAPREVRYLPGRVAALAAIAALLLFVPMNVVPEAVRDEEPLVAMLRTLGLAEALALPRATARSPADTFVAPGRLADGSEADALRPAGPLAYEPATRPEADTPRWRRFRDHLAAPQPAVPASAYGDYLCDAWNRRAPAEKRLLSFRLVRMRAAPAGAAEQQPLWRQDCRAGG